MTAGPVGVWAACSLPVTVTVTVVVPPSPPHPAKTAADDTRTTATIDQPAARRGRGPGRPRRTIPGFLDGVIPPPRRGWKGKAAPPQRSSCLVGRYRAGLGHLRALRRTAPSRRRSRRCPPRR